MKTLKNKLPIWVIEKEGELIPIDKKIIPNLFPCRSNKVFISEDSLDKKYKNLSQCMKNTPYGKGVYKGVLFTSTGERIYKHIGVLDWESASQLLNEIVIQTEIGFKKDVNPLSDDFLVKTIQSALSDWLGISSPADEAYLSEINKALNTIKSGGISQEKIYSLFSNASKKIYNDPFLVDELIPELKGVIDGQSVEFIRAIRGEYINQGFNILESLSIPDERAIKNLNDLGMRFMSDSFKKNYSKLSDSLYKKLIKGLEQGLNYKEVTAELASKFPAQVSAYTKNILDITAHSVISRSRSYGVMQSFSDAGIQAGVFSSVMDEVTTETCAFLNNQVVDIKRGKEYWDNQIAKEDMLPQDSFPWIQEKKSDDMVELLLPLEDQKIPLASGTPGNLSWNEGININDYAGNVIPPLHGYCRSTIIYKPSL